MRQEIMIQLRRHLNAVISKRPGQAFGLWGEAGLGKTFTVQALLQETPCKSLSLHATTPNNSLVLSLPRPPKQPAWMATLWERLGQGQHLEPQALTDTLATSLSALAPFVLHLEDVHEASPERLELIQKLAWMVPRLRGVGLLITSRNELPEPFQGHRLDPLNQEDFNHLLQTEAATELPRDGLGWVFARTEGNPLFALEFWRYLRRQSYFWSDGKQWHWKKPPDDFVPVSVEALILGKIRGLPESGMERAVLEARALLGAIQPEAGLWANVAAVNDTHLIEAQQALMRKSLLNQEGFVHPLVREVIERETPTEHKRTYARRALEMLWDEAPERAAEFIALAEPEPQQALRLIERAIDSARARGDTPSEARWLTIAVTYDHDNKARRALQAAQALQNFNHEQASRMAEIAVSVPNPDLEAVFLLVKLQASQGHIQQAEHTLGRLPNTEETRFRWWETLIWVRNHHSLFAEVVELWQTQPEFQARANPNTLQAVCYSLIFLHRLDEAQAIIDEIEQQPLETGWLNIHAFLQSTQGNLRAAVELNRQNLALCRSMGLTPSMVAILLNLSSDLNRLGERVEAQALLEDARTLTAQLGHTLSHAIIQMRLAIFLMERGQFEQAETMMLEGHAVLHGYSNLTWRTESHLKQARLYLTWLPPHGLPLAHKHASAALEYARQTQDAKFLVNALTYLARTEALLGNPAQALRVAQEALDFCTQKQHDTKMSDALFAYGLALEVNGRNAEALEAVRAACAQQGDEKLAQRFGLEADRLSKDLTSARKRHDWFVERGLLGLAEVALRYFPELNAAAQEKTMKASPFYLKVLGAIQIEQDNQPLAFRARKRLEVLCYLLEARVAGKQEVNLLELIDTFYPEVPETNARLTLRQVVYLIRSSLGADSILSMPNGYALGAVGSDIEEFLQMGDTHLWRGPYLPGFNGWNANVRDGLLLALRSSAEAALQTNPAEAERLGQIWLEMEPYDVDALRLTIRAQHAQGKVRAVTRAYQQAQVRLFEVGETLPETMEDFLSTPVPL
jgi:tetratricopeptide (TPR) repeat protein